MTAARKLDSFVAPRAPSKHRRLCVGMPTKSRRASDSAAMATALAPAVSLRARTRSGGSHPDCRNLHTSFLCAARRLLSSVGVASPVPLPSPQPRHCHLPGHDRQRHALPPAIPRKPPAPHGFLRSICPATRGADAVCRQCGFCFVVPDFPRRPRLELRHRRRLNDLLVAAVRPSGAPIPLAPPSLWQRGRGTFAVRPSLAAART